MKVLEMLNVFEKPFIVCQFDLFIWTYSFQYDVFFYTYLIQNIIRETKGDLFIKLLFSIDFLIEVL
jgi:hypothetical protein